MYGHHKLINPIDLTSDNSFEKSTNSPKQHFNFINLNFNLIKLNFAFYNFCFILLYKTVHNDK